MKTTTYECLTRLHTRHGPRIFGKICQKFVALAFRAGGSSHVVERGVQGVDVDAIWGTERYALEIRTTRTNSVPFLSKDVDGLASRRQDGYRPMLGALQLRVLARWYFANAAFLRPGPLTFDAMRPIRHRELEGRVQPLFDTVVERYFEETLAGSQAYLDHLLRQHGVCVECETLSSP
ncbi:MAG: hypothetical protein K2R98_34060 [Gemmataceae bacterium]|nr:hypothetical protein [Gemmataceae bacterium]